MDKPQFPKDLCKQILDLDKNIRFAGIGDSAGRIILMEYRKGLAPFLSKQALELSVMQSAIRMGARKLLEPKIGKTIYACALYEKVKRATIPMISDYILMVSFELDANHDYIILKKVLPLVKKYGLV